MAPDAGPRAPATDTATAHARPALSNGHGVRLAVLTCAVLAAGSLLVHATPGFDPWAWLVWGRQLARLELDTGTGLSWKPLPVLFTTPFAFAGAAAPHLWLLVARTGGLLAILAVYRLAARYGGWLAGVVAASTMLLTPGADARFLRLLAQGNVEPMVVALCLWAVDRHLAGRTRHALVLAVMGGLARPEVWPFALLYGLWLWRHEPRSRPATVGLLSAIPLLWFGGDMLGSGSALTGAQTASVVANDVGHRLTIASARVSAMVPTPVWGAALAGVVHAWQRGWGAGRALTAAALAWSAMVALMTIVFGYAALGRFLLPAAAVLCIFAGVGTAVMLRLPSSTRARVLTATVLLAVSLPFVVPRTVAGIEQVEFARQRAELDHDLETALAQSGGAEMVRAHVPIAIELDTMTLSAWPSLAWKLDLPLDDIVVEHRDLDTGLVIAHRDGDWDQALSGATAARPIEVLSRTESWVVFAVRGSQQDVSDPGVRFD